MAKPVTDPASEARLRHRRLLGAIFALGALLRIALAWRNPPFNAWDDHYEPILLLLTGGGIPGKLACFQCYHPPVFYLAAGALAWTASAVGIGGDVALKLLQYLNCAFGVATLLVTLAVVERIPVPRGARLAAALVVAVLPRHVYVSAVFGNDGLAVLLVTTVVWLLMRLRDDPGSWPRYAAIGAVATLAVFTKYNALIVLPGIAVALAASPELRSALPRRAAAGRAGLALGIPALLLAGAMVMNAREYGAALPGNDEYARRMAGAGSFVARQPRDAPHVDFLRFEPWKFVAHPLLRPGQLSQFWTLLHAGLWFDTDAKLVQMVASEAWAGGYYAWLGGDGRIPEVDPSPAMRWALWLGAALEALGAALLVPAALGAGTLLLSSIRRGGTAAPAVPAAGPILVMALFNVLGVAYWAARVPVYSAMKATFLLPSMGAMAISLALGFAAAERRRATWLLALALAGALAVAAAAHVAQLVLAPR